MDDEDEFFDTASLRSYASVNKRPNGNRNSFLSLSRNTIYHSAVDLDDSGMEMETLNRPNDQQNAKSWRRFSKSDLEVDFVLAYTDKNHNSGHKEKREIFEQHLEDVGLTLEREANQKISFVKIHTPHDVLVRYAEILRMSLPIKNESSSSHRTNNLIDQWYSKALGYCHIELDPKKFPKIKEVYMAPFSKEKDYLFDVNSENFFTSSIRMEIVNYILQSGKFGPEVQDQGIKKLLNEGVYKAAYPLHDGDIFSEGSERKLLYDEWARLSKCVKFQPIDNIKEYFGVKIALYFTWLGFYTHMLIPASVVGLLCFIYGLSTLHKDTLVQEICSSDVIMCPLCDKNCDFWRLSDTCAYSKVVHVVDNSATIFFSIFMSFWAALYLELWKRYSAVVTHRWGLLGFGTECEPPRPEYLNKFASFKNKKNRVTELPEPVVPFWKVKLPSIILSFSIALFWVLLAVAVVFGIVLYRMALLASNKLYNDNSGYSSYYIPLTAGLLNLVGILILNYIYNYLAEKLTELELQRTQSEFDNSLALKIYMFQFVNYYSCIFYIAFLKGKFVGYPSKYNRIFTYRQEECPPGGCLVELTIQLCIIMIGNQALNSMLEMLIPFLTKMYNSFKVSTGIEKVHSEDTIISCNQWTEDYKLTEMEPQGLFHEYLEMVLQYGFITIFVTAFPLAPLFALLNNVLEMRIDAQKFIKYCRRPVPRRVKDIGIWMPIMDILGKIAVASNAFIIAFSSHFIPQTVYYIKYGDLNGYLDFTLAHFNTEDFMNGTQPKNSIFENMTSCRYAEYRNGPDHKFKYKRPLIYWHILAARLAFVVVYQNLVSVVVSLVQWTIPDMSKKLRQIIQKETYKTNEIIIKYETERARLRLRKRSHSPSPNGDVGGDGGEHSAHKRNSLRNSLFHDIIES